MSEGVRLVKWYGDVVSPEGEVFIAYHAELRWRSRSLRLASVLRNDGASATRCSVTTRAGPPPVLDEAGLTWPRSRLTPAGRFTRLAPPVERTLYSEGTRSLVWTVVAPAAKVRVGDLAGLGYAERLETTIAPWRLPIDELRWGRFVSATTSLAWIEWKGPSPLRVVVKEGRTIENAKDVVVSEAGVGNDLFTLTLYAPRVLRRGSVASTVFARVPLLRRSLPARLLALDETKWVSKGRLTDAAGSHEGWAIHEVVRWP